MTKYSTAKTMKVPLDEDKVIALMHEDGVFVVEVTRIPWRSGDPEDRIQQALELLKADAEANGDKVTWRYKGDPLPIEGTWWPEEVPVIRRKRKKR